MQYISLSVARDKVQGSGYPYGFFIKIDGKHFVPDKIEFVCRSLGGRKIFPRFQALRDSDVLPDLENAVHSKSRAAAGRVDDRILL